MVFVSNWYLCLFSVAVFNFSCFLLLMISNISGFSIEGFLGQNPLWNFRKSPKDLMEDALKLKFSKVVPRPFLVVEIDNMASKIWAGVHVPQPRPPIKCRPGCFLFSLSPLKDGLLPKVWLLLYCLAIWLDLSIQRSQAYTHTQVITRALVAPIRWNKGANYVGEGEGESERRTELNCVLRCVLTAGGASQQKVWFLCAHYVSKYVSPVCYLIHIKTRKYISNTLLLDRDTPLKMRKTLKWWKLG